ncbi:MAG: disulfide bond formation protein B [Acidibrevibacterium sp.]|jgi:disulfide bond formation protein DsbB|uniref:disulfide bond formation protein B n=1 Tax=Acidibrevibacterium fodinaquatile TaxID=1969806 RepID=UPI0023A80C74|nr:disulfide bond formation protein B [Acidibrevibacterium fodinaquatile]MCA7120140.1 disulfide bond formation protein B [Acidibrevibacterium fodinaquatile]
MRQDHVRRAALLALLASALALAVAIASERLGGLVPCALCLVERWPYRIAIVLAALAFLAPPRPARWLLAALALVILADAALAIVHVGVEWHFWPSPLPECAAPHLRGSIAERLAAMPVRPGKPCDEPTYLVPGLPVSMAAMNGLYALALAAALLTHLRRTRSTRR